MTIQQVELEDSFKFLLRKSTQNCFWGIIKLVTQKNVSKEQENTLWITSELQKVKLLSRYYGNTTNALLIYNCC